MLHLNFFMFVFGLCGLSMGENSTVVVSSPPSKNTVEHGITVIIEEITLGNSTVEPVAVIRPLSRSSVEPVVVTTNVCDLSLTAVSEVEAQKEVKCSCTSSNVDCNYLGITDLPALISFPKNVHIAGFRGNKIENINKNTFYNGREVFDLTLSNNEINFISTDAFNGFPKLVHLDISHNKLWQLHHKAFQYLAALRRLDLSFNDIAIMSPDIFSHLTELRELSLKGNPLKELESKFFEHLGNLERLDLTSTVLKFLPDHVFVFTPKLRFLSLANNIISEVPTEAIKILHNLHVLDISGNPIDVIQPQAFRGLTGLVILYMDRMSKLKKIEKYAFGDMVHLQELHCSYNYFLSEIDNRAFVRNITKNVISVSQLFLRQNDFKSMSPALLSWTEDLELQITDNPLVCDCNIQWMIHLKLKNKFQKHARCESPDYLKGISIDNLNAEELTCGAQFSTVMAITCVVMVGLLIMLLVLAIFIWRRSYSGFRKPYFKVYKKAQRNDIEYNDGM